MRLIDLSEEIRDGQRYHFNVTITDFMTHKDTGPRFEAPAEGYAAKLIMMADHTSTHVDAPSHFWAKRRNIDEMPLDYFYGEGIFVDCSKVNGNGGVLGLQTFLDCLKNAGQPLQRGDVLLVKIQQENRDVFCGFDEELAKYLVEQGIKLLGVDRGTPDCGDMKSRPVHVNLLQNDIPIVENLRKLQQLAGQRFVFVGLPLKIQGGTGSPIRAVAMLDWN